jgi:hypothetical protein
MAKKETRSVRARREAYRAQQKRKRTLTALGIVGALIVIAVLFVVLRPGPMTAEDVQVPETLETPPDADGKAWGPEDAPVLVEEYSDFQ